MGKYIPYAGSNAIQEAVIGIKFQETISPTDLSNARMVWNTDLKNDFSRSEDIIGSQIHIKRTDQGGIQVEGNDPFHSSGFQLLSMGPDGKPSQILQISENHFTLHFMEYFGWQETLKRSFRYISAVLPRLNLEKNGIQSFNLRYVDRFTFDGQTNEANAVLLFQESSEFISSKCFDVGPYWHCHSGWFDNQFADSRILNQLNIQSRMIDGAATVTIDHNMIFHLRSLFNSVRVFMESAGGKNSSLKESLDHLHNVNHDVISGLLCPNMAERIGIFNESS
ncbi:MAG: TIGR04255 family protein [Gammaproteobacteria bacterium]|nr:TIGR04255 family protein [Gammaproteobacteria bacterium]